MKAKIMKRKNALDKIRNTDKSFSYSIIIPTHNSSDLIVKLLDSIPDISNVQVIIIDDHSSVDQLIKTKEIFSTYTFGSKKFLVNKGVNSAGAARNIGIDNAEGKWLIFADSDDYFTKNFLKLLDKYQDFVADMIFFTVAGNNITRRVDTLNKAVKNKNLNWARYGHPVPWGKIINKRVVDDFKIRFSETKVGNDEFFSTKVGLYSDDIVFDSTDGYYSVEREGSLTTQKHGKDTQDIRMYEALKKMEFLRKNLGRRGIIECEVSILPSVKRAIQVGGVIYALKWTVRLWLVGGRLNVWAALRRRASK